jgi:tRNA-intron lyase
MTSSSPTAGPDAVSKDAVKSPRPRGPTRAQQLNKLYALPAPLRTYPLPTFVPHNPFSLFHLVYTWLSQAIFPPSSHPEPLYEGWFSPETRSVHVTDPRSIRALWEQGFYGKGTLSRSEPSWLEREKKRKGADASQTSEEITRARRAERQQIKWERARKEREAIDQKLLEESKLKDAPVPEPTSEPQQESNATSVQVSELPQDIVEAVNLKLDDVVMESEQDLASENIVPVEIEPTPPTIDSTEPVSVESECVAQLLPGQPSDDTLSNPSPSYEHETIATSIEPITEDNLPESVSTESETQPTSLQETPVEEAVEESLTSVTEVDAILPTSQDVASTHDTTGSSTATISSDEITGDPQEASDSQVDMTTESPLLVEDIEPETNFSEETTEPISEPEPATDDQEQTESEVIAGDAESLEVSDIDSKPLEENAPSDAPSDNTLSTEKLTSSEESAEVEATSSTSVPETEAAITSQLESEPEPSPLVKALMTACVKRNCPITQSCAEEMLTLYDNKLVPAVMAVSRDYDSLPKPPREVRKVLLSPPASPKVDTAPAAAAETETTADEPISPADKILAPVGPLELLALPNSSRDIRHNVAAIETSDLPSEVDQIINSEQHEDLDVSAKTQKSFSAPTGPLELLALPNSAADFRKIADLQEHEIDASDSCSEAYLSETTAVSTEDESFHKEVEIQAEIADAVEMPEVALEAPETIETTIEDTITEEPRNLPQSTEATENVEYVAEVEVTGLEEPVIQEQPKETVETTASIIEMNSTEEVNAVVEVSEEIISDAAATEIIAEKSMDTISSTPLAANFARDCLVDINDDVDALKSPRSPKSVRFSPTVEQTTFIKSDAPSPELAAAQSVKSDEDVVAIRDQEHLQLTLEETLFLAYGMGVLTVYDPETKQPLSMPELFDACRAVSYYPPPQYPISGPEDPFLINYVVYHHFRSLGWVVRGGVKFSVDFLLYNRGPAFSHAEFAVLIIPSYTDPFWTQDEGLKSIVAEKEKRSWHWLHCINRVNSQVKKTLILVYVDIPPIQPQELEDKIGIDGMLKRYKIREVVMKRWLSNRSRD